MEKRSLKNSNIGDFIDILSRFGQLHGPTLSEAGIFGFARCSDARQLKLDYQRTQIPPKKYLIPFREEILKYREESYRPGTPNPPDIVLFGIHPCDLAGIAYLDLVFLGQNSDPCYAERRSRLTLVGISCVPDDFCFCPAPAMTQPCDLFLTARGDGYEIDVCSERGQEIADASGNLFTTTTSSPSPATQRKGVTAQDPQLRFSDNPLWEKFALTCVSCGACSVCCPTCYCFDVREYPALGGGGVRLREWDNCLFATHGEVAGANFRSARLDRLRYRFLHKYCGFTPFQGMTSCVGCGRCKAVCPVDIDLRELIPEPREKAGAQ